jgi:DNA-binding MarR family transcriptional regulator
LADRSDVLVHLLRSVGRGLFGLTRGVAREHNLPGPSLGIMHAVFRSPGVTISELARRTGMAKSQVSSTVESLCALGHLEKRRDPADQRLQLVHPGERARAQFQEMHAAMRARLATVISTLPEAKVEELIDGLEVLQAALEREAPAWSAC